MTDEEKAKAALAEKDQRIAELEAQLAGQQPPADSEDLTPSPTQAELNQAGLGQFGDAKAGAYKTRQTKAN